MDFVEDFEESEKDRLHCRFRQGSTREEWLVKSVERLLKMEKRWNEDKLKAGLKEEEMVKKIQQLELELRNAKAESNSEGPPKVLDPES